MSVQTVCVQLLILTKMPILAFWVDLSGKEMSHCTCLTLEIHFDYSTIGMSMAISRSKAVSTRCCSVQALSPNKKPWNIWNLYNLEKHSLSPRLLLDKVAPLFTKRGLDFKVEYVTSVRDWFGGLPKISTLFGACRRRSARDQKVVPHSFTFIRRECSWPSIFCLVGLCLLISSYLWITDICCAKVMCSPRYAIKPFGKSRRATSIVVHQKLSWRVLSRKSQCQWQWFVSGPSFGPSRVQIGWYVWCLDYARKIWCSMFLGVKRSKLRSTRSTWQANLSAWPTS